MSASQQPFWLNQRFNFTNRIWGPGEDVAGDHSPTDVFLSGQVTSMSERAVVFFFFKAEIHLSALGRGRIN